MRKLLFCVLFFCLPPLFCQLPEFYRTVDRLTWVVEDLDRAIQGWKKLGFLNIEIPQEVDLENVQFRGKPAVVRFRFASGRIGGVPVDFIQPHEGENAYREFLTRHGSGIFSLIHRAPTQEAFEKEVERLGGLGVGVLQRGTVDSDSGLIRYAYLDTEPEGKYVLGLLYVPGAIEDSPLAVAASDPSGRRISQYAFVARELEPVSRFWARLGFPEMSFTHPDTRELVYRGKPGEFDMQLGWQRHGTVVYEWILSLKGPNVYLDHLGKHGEGVHHIAFQVDDIDTEMARWTELGSPLSQAGAWGEKDKPGSGRFAYMDTQSIGGIDVELLWSYR